MITIRQPLCFSEIGLKDNQEDYLYPPDGADTQTRVFLMCDGMGGHDKGEVASRTAAMAMGRYLNTHPTVDVPTFEGALSAGYDALDDIDTGSTHKPGTTMTCLCLNEDSYLVAHMGDSRIYHIRPSLYDSSTGRGGVIYQSSDHSLVNDLIRAGEIKEEDARTFAQRNVITRAMQPHLETRYKADIYLFDNIESGDYFFLCSDGVLEQLTGSRLCEILADPAASDREKMNAIQEVCAGRTRDNYTCWLVPIDRVEIRRQDATTHVIQAMKVGDDDNATVAESAATTQSTIIGNDVCSAPAHSREQVAKQRSEGRDNGRRRFLHIGSGGRRADNEQDPNRRREIVIKLPTLSLSMLLRKLCQLLAILVIVMILIWLGKTVVGSMRHHVPTIDNPPAIENIHK